MAMGYYWLYVLDRATDKCRRPHGNTQRKIPPDRTAHVHMSFFLQYCCPLYMTSTKPTKLLLKTEEDILLTHTVVRCTPVPVAAV